MLSWKSKGISFESIKSHTTLGTASDYRLIPTLIYSGRKAKLKFTGSYLKQDKISYTRKEIVNICCL